MSEYTGLTVFTTGQVAKICQVAPRTVSKWFDSGRLKGYRIPGSQDRRIPRANLVDFMQSHSIPLGALTPVGPARVLLISVDGQIRKQLEREYPSELSVEFADSGFEAGSMAVNLRPHCVVVDFQQEPRDLAPVVHGLRRLVGKEVVLAGIYGEEGLDSELQQALDESFQTPVDAALVAARIHRLARSMAEKVR